MENSAHIIPPRGDHTQTIIFLHGRDSNATEFASELFESQASDDRTLLETFPTTRWVFPTSGVRDSARFGTPMSQWFDMWSVENPHERQELQAEGFVESTVEIMRLLQDEMKLITPEKIILGGISQGCAIAIHALLHSGTRLSGFIGLSSWLPHQPDITAMMARNEAKGIFQYSTFYNHEMLSALTGSTAPTSFHAKLKASAVLKTPVFLAHCGDDEVVPIANGEKLFMTLDKLGMVVSWKKYENGGHWVNEPQGVDDIINYVNSCSQIKQEY